ncbi:MAG: DUF4186 family protein [Candidatus Bathyarchaeota archaeon]
MSEDWKQTKPVEKKIRCTSTDCKNDLHCFKRVGPKKDETYRLGVCKDCGADLIDWTRLDKKDLGDVNYTVKALKYEFFRHHYWEHIEIDEKAIKKAKKMGPDGIRKWAEKRINKYIAPAQKDLFRDGIQTPLQGNIVFYAQHAIAACCRKCIEEWYDIDRNRSLSEDEKNYLLKLMMAYIEYKMPDIF